MHLGAFYVIAECDTIKSHPVRMYVVVSSPRPPVAFLVTG